MGAFKDIMEQNKHIREAQRREAPVQTSGGKLSGASKYLTKPRIEQATWEYAFIQYPESMQTMDVINREVNQMGACGWEMCERRDTGTGMVRQDRYFTLIFKRRTS